MSEYPVHPNASAMEALRDTPGMYCWYLGTERELIAADVIAPYMLQKSFSARRTLSTRDEYGRRIIIQKCSGGRLRVKKLRNDSDWRSAKTVERATSGFVARILERMRRPRTEERP